MLILGIGLQLKSCLRPWPVSTAFISLVALGLVSALVAVIIITREFLVTGLRLLAMSEGKVLAAGKWGKHKTVWQIAAIVLILLGLAVREDFLARWGSALVPGYARVFVALSHIVSAGVAVVTVVSGWMYLKEHWTLVTREL